MPPQNANDGVNVAIFHRAGLFRGNWLNWECFISQISNRLKFFLKMVAEKIANVLQSRSPKNLTGDHYKLAAVLMPIQERDDGAHLVLTKRAEQLNHHRGQVAFPGGRVDPDDRGELEAALRESHEEIGIDPSHVRVLGRLDQVTAAYDFVVTPFVGVIPPFYDFQLNPAETDAVFSVPIASLLEPTCLTIADHLSSHGEPVYHFYCDGWDIWGATARMIVQFLALVYGYQIKKL
jgi:8-oxo-dGTP pyrophosphatase MutT (NUDIX family)